jgi:hypothetical protein
MYKFKKQNKKYMMFKTFYRSIPLLSKSMAVNPLQPRV